MQHPIIITEIQYFIGSMISMFVIGFGGWYINTLQKKVYVLKQELNAWKHEAKTNEMFLQSIGDKIPEEEKETLIVDKDKEPSILKRIWWDVEDALYK